MNVKNKILGGISIMSNEKLQRYYCMFTDSWKFFKTYADVKDTDEYWKAVVDETHKISKKYGECKIIINLVLAALAELERIGKEGKNNGNAQ